MTNEPLRIGILGAARISALAIVAPAAATGHRLVAVAARDPRRAATFAESHGVERVHATYDDLLADSEIEAVYNPLPNALHGEWTLRAIAAGKHVLSEKPFAANADEARQVADAAQAADVVVLEAFHYPFHPLFQRAQEIVASGELGTIQAVEAVLRMPAPPAEDPRWSLEMAGGAVMDLGCYSLNALRRLGLRHFGGEPTVLAAKAQERAGHPDVDERLEARLVFPDGTPAIAAADMDSGGIWDFHLTVTGSTATLHVPDFVRPHEDDRVIIRRLEAPERIESLGGRSSYTYQLEVFAAAVRGTAALPWDITDAVAQAELIDAAYLAAGLAPRRQPQP